MGIEAASQPLKEETSLSPTTLQQQQQQQEAATAVVQRKLHQAARILPQLPSRLQTLTSALASLNKMALANLDQQEQLEEQDTRPERYTCRDCGKSFKTSRDLFTHKYLNLWETYLREYSTGRCKCLFCGEKFSTRQDFLQHWYQSSDHEDYALTFLNMGAYQKTVRRGQWLINESEDNVLQRRIRYEKEMYAVRRQVGAGARVLKTLQGRLQEKAMFVAECYGIPGSGKSTFVLSFILQVYMPEAIKTILNQWLQDADHYTAAVHRREEERAKGNRIGLGKAAQLILQEQGEWDQLRPRLYITGSVSETLQLIKKTDAKGQLLLKPYDVIMQDEDPALIGKGSVTAKEQIGTILQTMRERRISFFFISPVKVQYVSNPNLIFEVTHKKLPLKERVMRGIAYDREGWAMGWIQHPLIQPHSFVMDVREFDLGTRVRKEILLERLQDPVLVRRILAGEAVFLPIEKIYLCIKGENILKWQEAAGAESVTSSFEELKGLAENALATLKANMEDWMLESLTKEDVKGMIAAMRIVGRAEEQESIASLVYRMLKHERTLQKEKEREAEKTETATTDSQPQEQEATNKSDSDSQSLTGFSLDDVDYLPLLRKRPLTPAQARWVDIYEKYLKKESGWDSFRRIRDTTGYALGTVTEMMARIKGMVRQIRGAYLEIELLRRYAEAPQVVQIMPPPKGFKYPDDIAPQGEPDRVFLLADGSFRVCAWKSYASNSTIPLRERGNWCPEILKARELLAKGATVKLVLEGEVRGHFFSVEIDPLDPPERRTIKKQEMMPWPPDIPALLEAELASRS